MRCTFVPLRDGTTVVVCGPRTPRKRCYVCRALGADRLCDGPPQPGARSKTCDRPLHARCSSGRTPGEDRDYCPACWRARDPRWTDPTRTGELFRVQPAERPIRPWVGPPPWPRPRRRAAEQGELFGRRR